MKTLNHKKGFTIIELLVSVSIFIIVVFFSLGSVVVIFSSNRKSENLRVSVDNANFAMETMARDIRFGKGFDCTSGCTELNFTGSNSTDISYKVDNGIIKKEVGTGGYLPLTIEKYNVETLKFSLSGQASGDNTQPLVTIYLKGNASPGTKEATVFDMQTTISPRQQDS